MHSFKYEILSWTKSRSSSKWLLLNVVFCFVWKATTWQKGVEREILTLKREEGRSKKYKLRKGKRKTPFSGENRGGPLPTLAIGQSREISLNYWQMGTCSLDLGSSWFVGFHGSKHLFTNRVYKVSAKPFTISRSSLTAIYILQVWSFVDCAISLQVQSSLARQEFEITQRYACTYRRCYRL